MMRAGDLQAYRVTARKTCMPRYRAVFQTSAEAMRFVVPNLRLGLGPRAVPATVTRYHTAIGHMRPDLTQGEQRKARHHTQLVHISTPSCCSKRQRQCRYAHYRSVPQPHSTHIFLKHLTLTLVRVH